LRKFDEGTPQKWIDTIKALLEEIWTQNSMNGGTDRASSARAIVKGESLVCFKLPCNMLRENGEGEAAPIAPEHVAIAIRAVTQSVFPHRALEIQKLWMSRNMRKPADMTTRQLAAAVNRLNNALPLFPGGTEGSKFNAADIIGILEWALPQSWRDKFNLDLYVPSQHSKATLIEHCEAIEQSEAAEKRSATSDTSSTKVKPHSKDKGKPSYKNEKTPAFFCTEHGKNYTHSTAECRVLLKKKKTLDKKVFSNKNFQKEINLLAKSSSKTKVLDLYSAAITRE
jgi:hypothetical protein